MTNKHGGKRENSGRNKDERAKITITYTKLDKVSVSKTIRLDEKQQAIKQINEFLKREL